VIAFVAGTCSQETGSCQCTAVQDSNLISGFYGDACQFVKYNRSGIYSFSTSVQSASKFDIYVSSQKSLLALTRFVQISHGDAVEMDRCCRSCIGAGDHSVFEILGSVLKPIIFMNIIAIVIY